MLETQKFIRSKGLEAIKEELAISFKRHKVHNNLVLFVYDQLDSPKSHPVVRECRGLILDENKDWAVVNYTYSRFFNAGEGCADVIDWSSAKVLEKADGSLGQLFYYNGEWIVATKGTPDAGGSVGDWGFTFKDLFWRIWNELGYKMPNDTNVCYAFELCSKFNRVVVRHQKERIILHGARNISTLQELNPEVIADKHGWECIKSYPLSDLDAVVKMAENIDPMAAEGFVVVDSSFNRLKIKSPAYVAVSHLKDGMDNFSVRRMLELIKTGEADEFLSYYQEYQELYNEVKLKYDNLLVEIESFYDTIKDIVNQKEFASHATKKSYSGVLFKMRRGDKAKDFINSLPIDRLENLLGIDIHG